MVEDAKVVGRMYSDRTGLIGREKLLGRRRAGVNRTVNSPFIPDGDTRFLRNKREREIKPLGEVGDGEGKIGIA